VRSLVGFAAGFFVGEFSDGFWFELFFCSLSIDHPSKWLRDYFAALEKVEALTPLIFPYELSCYLMLLGLMYVYLVVEVYLT
jgi:hypothetical protein